jgi:hypothetical protein
MGSLDIKSLRLPPCSVGGQAAEAAAAEEEEEEEDDDDDDDDDDGVSTGIDCEFRLFTCDCKAFADAVAAAAAFLAAIPFTVPFGSPFPSTVFTISSLSLPDSFSLL